MALIFWQQAVPGGRSWVGETEEKQHENSCALSPPNHSPILLNSQGFAQNLCVLCVSKKQSSHAVVSPSQSEAPADPNPCRERCTDPCCSVKTLAIAHTRTSVRWLGRSLAFPSLHPSVHRIPENFEATGRPPDDGFCSVNRRFPEDYAPLHSRVVDSI
jgi:hypothetical protein